MYSYNTCTCGWVDLGKGIGASWCELSVAVVAVLLEVLLLASLERNRGDCNVGGGVRRLELLCLLCVP